MGKYLISILLFLFIPQSVVFSADKEPVTLSRVYDGDTIEIINQENKKENVRLNGIDCYETTNNNRAYKQAYENNMKIEEVVAQGIKAKIALVEFFKNNSDKQLYIIRTGKDRYDRTLGIIFADKININEYMLKSGNALKYTYIKQ